MKRTRRYPVEYGRLAPRDPLPYDTQLLAHVAGELLPVATAGDSVEIIAAHLGGGAGRALGRLRKAVIDQQVRAVRLDPVRQLYVVDDVERVAQAWAALEDARASGW